MEQVVPHSHADKLGGTAKEQDRLSHPGFQRGEIKPQNLWLWEFWWQEKLTVSQESPMEGLTGP